MNLWSFTTNPRTLKYHLSNTYLFLIKPLKRKNNASKIYNEALFVYYIFGLSIYFSIIFYISNFKFFYHLSYEKPKNTFSNNIKLFTDSAFLHSYNKCIYISFCIKPLLKKDKDVFGTSKLWNTNKPYI